MCILSCLCTKKNAINIITFSHLKFNICVSFTVTAYFQLLSVFFKGSWCWGFCCCHKNKIETCWMIQTGSPSDNRYVFPSKAIRPCYQQHQLATALYQSKAIQTRSCSQWCLLIILGIKRWLLDRHTLSLNCIFLF